MLLTCPECGTQFEPRKAWQKYCDRDCNQTAYLKRKLEKKRANPLHALDLSLDLGPSPVQEAEWKRRSEIADNEAAKQPELEEDNKPIHQQLDIRLDIAERNKSGRTLLDTGFGSGGYAPPKKEDK